MKKFELNIIVLVNSELSKGNYFLILEELKGFWCLLIVIGVFEV